MLSPLLTVLMASAATPAAEPMRFDGIYENGLELSAFIPCDGDGAHYWVAPSELPPKLATEIDRHSRRSGGAPGVHRYRVKLTGTLSESGEWGHMGLYARELSVTKMESFERVSVGADLLIPDCRFSNGKPQKST